MITLVALILTSPVFACDDQAHASVSDKIRILSAAPAPEEYGAGIQLQGKPLSLKEAAKSPSETKEVLIQAKIGQVCQQKGCWMMLEDGDTQVRVTFKDYSFFVPKNAGKKKALVQGRIFEKEISQGEARHYAKDEGLSKAKIAQIKGPQKSLWVEATGVRIE